MKLHLLDNGVLLLGKENPVLLDRNEAETSNDIPVHSFLLDTSIGYILFDCACDDEGMKVWPEWLKQTPYQPGENGTVVDSLRKIEFSRKRSSMSCCPICMWITWDV